MRSVSKISLVLVSLFFLSGIFYQCAKRKIQEQPQENKMTNKTIEQVLNEHTEHLMSLPGVVGTAQGELKGKPCLKVYVVQKTAELERQIPKEIEGFPVVIEVTGKFKALGKD